MPSGNENDFEKENLIQELSEEKDTISQPNNIKKEVNTEVKSRKCYNSLNEVRNRNLPTDVSDINTRNRGTKRNM